MMLPILGNPGHLVKECGCKGIRTCLLCQSSGNTSSHEENSNIQQIIYQYCVNCQKAWPKSNHVETLKCLAKAATEIPHGATVLPQSCSHNGGTSMEFPGIHIFENFVTEEEEAFLDAKISNTSFVKSQSGRKKQDFGPKVNFKKQKLKTGTFNGLPSYSRFLYERMKEIKILRDFEPVELCNLEYSSDRGAHIDPHIDDTWLWGEQLVTLNLISDSILSFTLDSKPDLVIHVPLLQYSLITVSGPARYEWKHSINSKHISGRRIAMTFRNLSDEFQDEGVRAVEGREILKLALSFQGVAVGSML